MAKITFHPSLPDNHIFVAPPKPASQYRADWYDKVEAFYDKLQMYGENHSSNLTIKHCVPFRDALFAGYIQESWQEIHFEASEDGNFVNYRFPSEPDILGHRDRPSLPMGSEYYPIEFVIKVPWSFETPSGWSVLITQPFNRPELPFFVPAAILDSDYLKNTTGEANVPVYLRKDAPQLIKSGTPLYQIIPFKRENWESQIADFDLEAQKRIIAKTKKYFWGGYKKQYWQKKTYK